MAIVAPKASMYKCEYLADPSDDESRCQRTRSFRLLTKQLCNQTSIMRHPLKLDNSQTGHANYCEMHAILVHYRRNQPPIEYVDRESQNNFEAMAIYRIYRKLIELTEEGVMWCMLQNDVLKQGQTALRQDLISIKQRFKFPFWHQTTSGERKRREIHNIDELIDVYMDEFVTPRRVHEFKVLQNNFDFWRLKQLKLRQDLYKFISVLAKHKLMFDDRKVLLKKLKKQGCEIEGEQRSRDVRSLKLPFNIDKTDRRGFGNDAIHFDTIHRCLRPSDRTLDMEEQKLTGRKCTKPELKYREYLVPMVSLESFPIKQRNGKEVPNKPLRECLAQLIKSVIHSDIPLAHLTVTAAWQLALVSVGSGPMRKTLKGRLETRYHRVAIRRMVGDEDKENRKFVIWCLDETNYCMHWVSSVGPVYALPQQLNSNVLPWLAKHVWFDARIAKDDNIAKYYLSPKKGEVKAKTQAFIARWVDNYDRFTINSSNGSMEPLPTMPWSVLGDVYIEHTHRKQVDNKFSLWWAKDVMTTDSTVAATTLQASELFREMTRPSESVYAIRVVSNDAKVKPKAESLVKRYWMCYEYMLHSLENYTRKHPPMTRDVIRRKIMMTYYNHMNGHDYSHLTAELNRAVDHNENERMGSISETQYDELMHYYDKMYNGNLQYPGWETAEKHKNALNINIPSLSTFPTPPLPPHLKHVFERLFERRQKPTKKSTPLAEEPQTEPVTSQKPLAELGGGDLVVVKNEKGVLQVEKQKWSSKHKEVVESLDIEDEESTNQRETLASTLDFLGL